MDLTRLAELEARGTLWSVGEALGAPDIVPDFTVTLHPVERPLTRPPLRGHRRPILHRRISAEGVGNSGRGSLRVLHDEPSQWTDHRKA